MYLLSCQFSPENIEGTGNANIVALIAAILVFIASAFNIYIIWNNNKSNVVSKNRLVWINDVRALMFEFLKEYTNGKDSTKMKNIKFQVMLYMREGVTSYKVLIEKMNKCIEEDYSDKNCDELIKAAQDVFSEVWIRLKREAGISKLNDNRFTRMFESKKQ